jgi:hypothetical protein
MDTIFSAAGTGSFRSTRRSVCETTWFQRDEAADFLRDCLRGDQVSELGGAYVVEVCGHALCSQMSDGASQMPDWAFSPGMTLMSLLGWAAEQCGLSPCRTGAFDLLGGGPLQLFL